jgi:HEAT repeat protein
MSDPVIRSFALLAAAEAGGRFTPGRAAPGVGETRATLVEQLAWGKNALETWSALACGVLARRLSEGDPRNPALDTLRKALRRSLDEEGSPERLGAHALGAGLAGSSESAPRLMKLLEKELDDEARGQVAIALALLGHLEAVEPLRGIVARSRYRPELLSQAAIALALLGDKDVPTQLAGLLAEAHSLAAQAAITTALGFIGDRRSVDPLLALLGDRLATAKARAFAAVALGNVADKELRPWNSKIGFGLNYLAAPATLFDPLGGKGILDIR